MGAPHNKARYGETWPQDKITLYVRELCFIKGWVVLSGGWAWHFMSPEGHTELKHAHDHKDMDVFVKPEDAIPVINILKVNGWEKVATKYDRLPSEEDFRRYEKIVDGHRLTIDFFVKDVPAIEVKGHRVVEPKTLLGFYSNIHSSDNCFAVLAASKLVAKDISPVDKPELVEIPE